MEGYVEAQSLTKVYRGGGGGGGGGRGASPVPAPTPALDSVSFRANMRGVMAVIGRNGAGKTTLLRILSTELLPTSGRAFLDGVDVVAGARRLREDIAVIPQEARPIPWATPKQLVTAYLMYRGFPHSEAVRRAGDALGELGMAEHASKPNRMLSGGMKRKALLAAAVASEARVLFLDEPTTGLDPISREEIWRLLGSLKQERFVLLTTHYLEEAERLADSIVVLDSGRLRAIGTMDELRALVKYPYVVEVHGGAAVPRSAMEVGRVVGGRVYTTAEGAYRLAEELMAEGARFSVSPVGLDEVFHMFAGGGAGWDGEEEQA